MKLMFLAAILIAAFQYLSAEALIVIGLVPLACAIARPIARSIEALMAPRG
ncbi:hypothetical protein D3C78_1954750 [compost metagenome]